MENLVRVNRVTAQFVGEGMAQVSLYRTHDKLATLRTDDPKFVELGFVMPESVDADPEKGIEAVQVTPKQKLDALKDFIMLNASRLGYLYDPQDRRTAENKFPSSYDEAKFSEFAVTVVAEKIKKIREQIKKNLVALAKTGQLSEGAELTAELKCDKVEIAENYKNGNIKYGTAVVSINLGISGIDATLPVVSEVSLVSGQLKKPREIYKAGENNETLAFTVTGIKGLLVEAGILPTKEESTESATCNFDKLRKDELSSIAKDLGIEFDEKKSKKAEIKQLIEAKVVAETVDMKIVEGKSKDLIDSRTE